MFALFVVANYNQIYRGRMSVKETAEKWGLSERRVQILCSNNRIQGVIRINRMWLIPKNAEKPIDRRYIRKCEKDGAKE